MHSQTISPAIGAAWKGDFSDVKHLLDVGGGSGAFCFALARRYPQIHCTILELPTICKIAKEYIAEAGLSDRVDPCVGDFFKDPFPSGYVEINYNQRVNNIGINNQNFELNINDNNQDYFDTVINAGYATGLEIPIPAPRNEQYIEGNLVKLKVYGLYKIPLALKLQLPELKKKFSSTILIRGQYGGIIKVGAEILAIFSGREYNQTELYFPVDKYPINIPTDWFQNLEKITGRTEKKVTKSIKHDIARWIPWAKELEDIKLKKAVQVYPSRKPANDLEAAQRDDNPVRYMYQHKNGGKYIHIPGFKLTSIPYQAFQVALEILSIYIRQGILTQEQVDQHIMLDSNKYMILSPEMEYALGKDLDQSAISEREKIREEWDIY